MVLETSEFALTDRSGNFILATPNTLPLTFKILAPGYKPFEEKIDSWLDGRRVTDDGRRFFYLDPEVVSSLEVLVEAEAERRETARRVITRQEVQKAAGTGGDAIKVVQDMPGVARTPFSGGGLIVRGSALEDTGVYMDGHEIPLLFHFGGLTSTFNSDLIRDLRFYPGVYSVRYGHEMGGIVDIRSRAGDATGTHGYVDADFYDAGTLLEGPVKNFSYTASLRRSYADAIIKAAVPEDVVRFTLAPRYYDYEASVGGRFLPRMSGSLMAFGSDDKMALVLEEPPGREVEFSGNFNSNLYFHRLLAKWSWDLGANLRNEFSTAAGPDRILFRIAELSHLSIRIWNTSLRDELFYQPTPWLTLYPGIHFVWGRGNYDARFPRIPREDDPEHAYDPVSVRDADGVLAGSAVSPYLEAVIRPISRISLTPGVRLDRYTIQNQTPISPRMTARYQLLEPLTFKVGAGLVHQPPEPQDVAEGIGQPELGVQRAAQYTGGFEVDLPRGWSGDIQGFYKDLSLLVVRKAESDISNYDPSDLENGGIGRIYGSEVYLSWKNPRGFAWCSYTLSRSERRDHPGEDYRFFSFDQTHILTVVGTLSLTAKWDLGARFRYSTGRPETPFIDSIYDADRDRYIPIPGELYSVRIPGFHQLDVRVDRRWRFNTWMLTSYLDIQNVYVQKNPEGFSYNYDYSERQAVTGIPIFPSFGLRAEF
ncbi:MAG: TonB-dependent receptor plug domain-containing protein [Nitrospirae bacterium]|nr:TonB-dependent receptor plug domain-containing protein [Nitrospirota bacterium]